VYRIFITMASVAVMLLAITLILGLRIGDVPELTERAKAASQAGDTAKVEEIQAKAKTDADALVTHRLFAIGTAIFVLFVNSMSITYFVGTSRWCREVGETYGLEQNFAAIAQSHKRRNFPYAVLGMLTILFIAGFGAAADWSVDYPVNVERAARWATPHLISACVGVGVLVVAFYLQALKLHEQGNHIARIMDEVARIRKERGLND
jgi:hypothetical protein